jgi:adenosylmethionine-8-amino-7-oxononanoate aminotransferase
MSSLDASWMPFTYNRDFQAAPRLVASTQGVSYHTEDGRSIPDGTSGLWCVGAGHRHPKISEQENLIDQVNELTPYFDDVVHSLASLDKLVSVRNFGLAAGIELAANEGAVGQRGFEAQAHAFKHGLQTRAPGDTLVMAPPFITTRAQLDQMIEALSLAIHDIP